MVDMERNTTHLNECRQSVHEQKEALSCTNIGVILSKNEGGAYSRAELDVHRGRVAQGLSTACFLCLIYGNL